jgi:transposase-like protein
LRESSGARADLLYQWQKALAPQTARESKALNSSAQEQRIHELEREVATLREEREILKKATASSWRVGSFLQAQL